MNEAQRFEARVAKLASAQTIRLSLTPIQVALSALGNPEKAVKTLVVSGTNGKGSTTLLISAALKVHGYRVLTYLSPHLQSITERYLNGLKPIPPEKLHALLDLATPVAVRYELSHFEILTLLFFLWAREVAPDYVVLEVGLGGRLDATNVTDPIATVLTNVAMDHMEYLGNTLESILTEKAGVFRSKTPIFTGIQTGPLHDWLRTKADSLSSPLFTPQAPSPSVLARSIAGQRLLIDGDVFTVTNPSTATVPNAHLALTVLRNVFPEIALATIQEAFSKVKNPGRFETVQGKPRVILSGDHNPAGLATLIETLQDAELTQNHTLCAFSPDKPAKEMIEALKPLSQSLLLTTAPGARGTYDADYSQLAEFEPDCQAALKRVRQRAGKKDTILVTGSLYLVGALRGAWVPEVSFFEEPA